MGEDIAALIREWCLQKRIFFVHLRDVKGNREHFQEVFHDEGPVDLAQMLRIYAPFLFLQKSLCFDSVFARSTPRKCLSH
jgi:D-mannonate dehydratase